jgi:Xaa-Pro aminopeptidase
MNHQKSLQNRRQKLFEMLENNSSFLIFSNQMVTRNADVEYSFRQDSSFYYLTGIDEDSSVYFLKKDLNGEKTEILFIQEKTHQEQIWTGAVNGREKSLEISGIETILNFKNLIEKIEEMLKNTQKIYFDPNGSYQLLRSQINNLIFNSGRRQISENLISAGKTNSILRNLRMYKDEWEIAQMEKSAEIAIEAHIISVQKMYQRLAVGKKVYEYEVCSDLYHHFGYNNCTWSYPAIVAGGANACILHYTANDKELKKGDLLLIDAGCEYNYYASDITRCYPVSGKFTDAKKAVYEVVLRANEACIREIARNGSTYSSYHELSIRVLTQGLIDLGILKGTLEENITAKTYFKYYMHGIGHWLGLDVHDSGIYVDKNGKRSDIEITEGMTLTVEPGLYFDPTDESIPEQFRGIGIRIEDDILKTKDGILNLTEKMPKTVEEIEGLCGW